jgi:PII-like signaling protein
VSEDCLKLTAYFGERQRSNDRFVAEELLDLYAEQKLATSVMLRGIASYGPHQQLRSDESLSLSEDPSVAIVAVDTRDKVARLVEHVIDVTPRGLVTLERAQLLDGHHASPVTSASGATKLTVYVGRHQRVDGRSAFRAICDLLYREGVAGASVFLGVDGTRRGRRERARFFSNNVDVPLMIISVGDSENIARVVPQLDAMLDQPFFTLERIRVCKRDGELRAHPDELPAADSQGRPLWQKLMIYTSSDALHDGSPIHRILVRKLRASGAASGVTVLRGIWGFHGRREPHGDKLFQLTRRVPVTTIIVDPPDRIARSFEIVDECTREHGLVTSELVPALVYVDGEKRIGGTELADHHY